MTKTPNHDLITRDYPGSTIISVEEYYMPGAGYTSLLTAGPYHGKHVFDNDIPIDTVLQQIHTIGGGTVIIKLRTKGNRIVWPEYQVKSLFA